MSDARRPNIILIITDQQRYDTVGALGFPYADTPHIDRLIGEGVSFDNCYITGASCVPSRASLFNGYYPHTTGVLRNGNQWQRTWVERLNAAGYHCLNVGKMHTLPYNAPAGFHERHVVENKDRYLEHRYFFDEWDKALAAHGLVKQQRELYRQRDDYDQRLGAFEWELPEHLHSDVFVGQRAKWWLETHPQTEPLFLQIGFPGPHPPFDPVARYAEPYLRRTDLPIPEVSATELASLPPAYQELRRHNTEVDHDSVLWSLNPSREQLHRMWAYYMANVTMIDEQIGALLQTLDRRGYLEDSVIIFTSDHGDCMGHHGQIEKWTMYDDITRVPCVFWGPGRFVGGQRIDGLCQLFDLGPTILELAGVDVPESFEAQSLLPALLGREWRPREWVYTEQQGDFNLTGARFETGVRSREWKLVHFLGEATGQLFNLKEDPGEVSNLWDSPEHQIVKAQILGVLGMWHLESQFHTRQWAREIR